MNIPSVMLEPIQTIPELQSCLYDLNLLPEVLAAHNQGPGTKEYFYMCTLIVHFEALQIRLQGTAK